MPQPLSPPDAEPLPKLLIADDELALRSSLTQTLQRQGHEVVEASSNLEALARLASTPIDLMILNTNLPGMNGVEVMRQIRQAYADLLIIILTAHPAVDSAIAAVKANVSDYLSKPCSVDDLVAAISRAWQGRVRNARRQHLLNMINEAMDLLRQADGPTASPVARSAPPAPLNAGDVMHVGPLILDRQKRLATVNDDSNRVVELTEGEMSILAMLMEHPNQVLSCNQLADVALGYHGMDKWTVESVIRSCVFRLRQKIEPSPDAPRLICTVRGRGYFFPLT